jgi:hypothetical protein
MAGILREILKKSKETARTETISSDLPHLPLFPIHLIEEVFYRKVMDRQKPAEAFDCDIRFPFLDAPILHPRQVEFVGKIFVTAITFFFTQVSEPGADVNQRILQQILFHNKYLKNRSCVWSKYLTDVFGYHA